MPVSNSITAPTNSLSINIDGGIFLVDCIEKVKLKYNQVGDLKASNIKDFPISPLKAVSAVSSSFRTTEIFACNDKSKLNKYHLR